MRRQGGVRDTILYCLVAMVIGAGVAGVYDVVAHPGLPGGRSVSVIRDIISLGPPFEGKEKVTILLVGSDDREEVGRSDTLMVCYLNPQLRRAALLSIPRDLRVPIPGHGLDKINHAYFYGELKNKGDGVRKAKHCVEELIGERIDYYAHVTFEMFVNVVDMLGGVDIDVPDYDGEGRGMNYDCPGDDLVIHLFPGPQHLDGYKAMGFVRYRMSNVPGKNINDDQRAANQQMFLKAIVEQKLHSANIHRLLRAASYVSHTIDTDIPWEVAVDLVKVLRKMKSEGLFTATVPIYDAPRNGIYYAEVRERAFWELREEIRFHLAGVTEAPAVVEVLNGSGGQGAAGMAAALLEEKGFRVEQSRNADSFDHSRTLIEHVEGKEEAARKAAKVMGVAEPQLKRRDSTSLGQLDLRITVGKDFELPPGS